MQNPNEQRTTSILIVDDEPKNIQLIGNVLKEEGIDIEFAVDGENALNWLNQQHFDLILLDVMMPEMDGYEVCQRIKKEPATKDIPIIFLTAKTDLKSIVKGFEVGAVDYVAKPFNIPELLARVRTHLKLYTNDKKLQSTNRKLLESLEVLRSKEQEIEYSAKVIREKEEQLSIILNNMSSGILLVDKDFKLQVFNDQFLELYEILSEQTQKGIPLVNLIRIRAERGDYGPGDVDELVTKRFQEYRDHIQKGGVIRYEDTVRGNRTLENFRTITEDGGTVLVVNDITERKQTEIALKEREETINKIFESSPQNLAITRISDSKLLKVNQAMVEFHQLSEEELLKTDINSIFVNQEAYLKFVDKLQKREKIRNLEFEVKRLGTGELRWIAISLSVVKYYGESVFIAAASDITERKQAEAVLQKNKLELQSALLSEKQAHEELKAAKLELAETEAMAAMTTVFEKFVPKQFLSRIASEGIENIELGKADSIFTTILFADIRAFTTFSETVTPQELLDFLNNYFKRMSGPINENYGFVDKFIGDGIMALFDRPGGTDIENAQGAIQAAIGMQKALQLYNQHRQSMNYPPIRAGIGIHSGPIIIGTVGWEDRMDSTILGDNVNLASRIEGLTKLYGADILISDLTLRVLEDPTVFQQRELDWVSVRGKKEPVGIHEIFDMASPEIQELKRKSGRSILRALAYRRRKDWNKALAALEKAQSIYPEDQAVQLHMQRIQQLQTMELPDDWNGAIDLD